MPTTTPVDLQRMEVDLILQSGLFAKAPRLERFFVYICARHFEGAGDQIKEYSVALEALGRSSDFDPKKDSIVRVEAHRLRKRLQEYYEGPGAGQRLRVTIPNGKYQPQFTVHEASYEPPNEAPVYEPIPLAEVLPAPPPPLIPTPSRADWLRPVLFTLAFGCFVALILLLHGRSHAASNPTAAEVWLSPPNGVQVPGEFRMLVGYHGAPRLDHQGHTWIPDAFYSGGISSTVSPARALDEQGGAYIIKAQRSGKFHYDIPLRQATYEVHLYFLETEYGRGNPNGGAEGTRVFQVSINSQVELKLFDPLANAGGPNRLYECVFKNVSPQKDGALHLAFDPGTAPAFLNAIEILPSPPDRIHPVRIVAQENPVTDSDGRLWAADEYFCGGSPVQRRNVVSNSREALYQGERYGNFSYRIPLAPGKYRVTLHFAETWFGTPESHSPAVDSRIFNVFANGVTLLRDYDIAKDAGGPNRSVQKVFENLEPNAQGILSLDFVPVRNYAEVNALEVVETE